MSENSIALLQKAEDQAAKDIRAARERRNQRLKLAKTEAASSIASYRDKKERRFNQAETLASGPDADLARKIDSDTQQDIQQMQADYERNREKVIQVLLAAVTTVHIDVAASMKVKSN